MSNAFDPLTRRDGALFGNSAGLAFFIGFAMLAEQAHSAEWPPRGRLVITQTLGCSNGAGARKTVNQSVRRFEIRITRSGDIFDVASGNRDRGIHYIPDGRRHGFTEAMDIGPGRQVTGRGSASASWNGRILRLHQAHSFFGNRPDTGAVQYRIADRSLYAINPYARTCTTASVNFTKRYLFNGFLIEDVSCGQILAQSCQFLNAD